MGVVIAATVGCTVAGILGDKVIVRIRDWKDARRIIKIIQRQQRLIYRKN